MAKTRKRQLNTSNVASKDLLGVTSVDDPTTSIIFLKNLPLVLYEDALEDFFNQFGTVFAVRVLRCKKTLRSRGIAWVKFAHERVAEIAAETMHNYLIVGKLIKCAVLRQSQVPPMIFSRRARNPQETTIGRAVRQKNTLKSEKALRRAKVKRATANRALAKRLKKAGFKCGSDDDESEKKEIDANDATQMSFKADALLTSTPKSILSTFDSFCTAHEANKSVNSTLYNTALDEEIDGRYLMIVDSDDDMSFGNVPNAIVVKKSKTKKTQ